MTSVVTEEGRVLIPLPLLQELGITPGTTLDFATENGALVARKQPPEPHRQWVGHGRQFAASLGIRTTDELLSRLRDGDSR